LVLQGEAVSQNLGYSPECVEWKFSEVYIRDPAQPRVLTSQDRRARPPQLDQGYLHVVVVDRCAVRWISAGTSL
jgi:hypothetical protein